MNGRLSESASRYGALLNPWQSVDQEIPFYAIPVSITYHESDEPSTHFRIQFYQDSAYNYLTIYA
jgi:hypothetical protein